MNAATSKNRPDQLKLLEYDKAESIINKYGIQKPEAAYVYSKEEATAFAQKGKIALKVISEKALHKSKSGVIAINLDATSAGKSYTALYSKAKRNNLSPFKILAQRMSEPGTEIIIGANTDEQFGKLILIGLGGVYVETFKDVSVRTCPINEYDATSMLRELRAYRIIAPEQRTERMLVSLLMRVSKMVASNEWIKELDLNPVIINKEGYSAVDIRIML